VDRYPEVPDPSDEEARRLLDYARQVREFVLKMFPPDIPEP
jgi:hypothetical protein